MIRFYSGTYKCLTVFTEMEPDEVAEIIIDSAHGIVRKKAERFQKIVFPLTEHMEYTLKTTVGTIRYAYLCGTSKQETKGISFLTGKEDETAFHFMPHGSRLQTLGDFVFYKGKYHIFYAFNPFSESADLLYLGHAVSHDMVSWKEMPVLLEPHEALGKVRHRRGGAAGGSAEVMEDRIRFYATRRIEDRKTGELLREYLTWTQSRDAVHIAQEKPMHLTVPNTKNKFFRDPKVIKIEGIRYMMVGSAATGRAAVLLYREKGDEWEYRGALFRIGDREAEAIGMPDFFALGRTKVALGTLLGRTDAGNKNSVCWYTGTLQNEKMRIRQRGRLDFGGDFHAPHTVEKEGRRLLLGCLSGGSLSVPRELFVKKGRLCQKPATEAYAGELLYSGAGQTIKISALEQAYRGEVLLSGETDFKITIGGTLALCCEKGKVFLQTEEGCFFANTESVRKVDFFIERGCAEVFVNEEEAGTKRFTTKETTLEASFAVPENIAHFMVFSMRKTDDETAF